MRETVRQHHPGARHRHGSRQGGFTITELIIASTLAVVISAMMFTVLTTQERTSGQTETNAHMQDQLRFALQVMTKHMRMAGYGIGTTIAGTSPASLKYPGYNVSLPSFSGLPTLFGCDKCGGYDYDPASKSDTSTFTDQVAAVYRNPALEFQLDRWFYQKIPSTSPLMACSTINSLQPAPLEPGFAPISLLSGSHLVCMDESGISSTSVSMAWTLQSAGRIDDNPSQPGLSILPDPATTSYFTTACSKNIPYRMTCGSLVGSSVGFYVHREKLYMDDNGDSYDVTNLKLVPQLDGTGEPIDDIPLASGIEDMQIAYCIPGYPTAATNSEADIAAALADCFQNPETSGFWAGSSTVPLKLNQHVAFAVAMRITLVAKGEMDRAGRLVVSKRPAAENHSPSDVSDSGSRPATTRYPRLVQSTVIQLPNPRYLRGLSVEFE